MFGLKGKNSPRSFFVPPGKKAKSGEIPHHCFQKFFRRVRTAHHDGFRKFLIPICSQLVAQAFQPVQARAKACGYQ